MWFIYVSQMCIGLAFAGIAIFSAVVDRDYGISVIFGVGSAAILYLVVNHP